MYNRGCYSLRKTADILRLHQRFPREKRTEERAQKFHTDDEPLPWSGWCFWLVEANFPRNTSNRKHYSDMRVTVNYLLDRQHWDSYFKYPS